MKGRWTPLCVFALPLVVYLSSRVMVQSDSIWSIPTAASLYLRGDVDLDEYSELLQRHRHGVLEHAGHSYNDFPLGPSIAALPFIAAIDLISRLSTSLIGDEGGLVAEARRWQTQLRATSTFDYEYFNTTERAIASVFTSLAMILVFLTVRRNASLATGLVIAAVMAFGTSAYSTASRVLWQHGPSMAALAGVVFLLTCPRESRGPRWAGGLGLAVAAAYCLRPTNSVTVLAVTGYLILRHRAQLLPYLGGAVLLALPFCAVHVLVYDAVLPPYYLPGRLEPGSSQFWQALVGNLVSPARGLLVYSPIFVWSLYAIGERAIRRRLDEPGILFALILLVHWIAISSFPHWWGGHSIGPRFFTDVIPFLAYFLIEPVERLQASWRDRKGVAALAAVAIAVSVLIHTRAATSYAVHGWNDQPVDVELEPARLWSWQDPPFLRR